MLGVREHTSWGTACHAGSLSMCLQPVRNIHLIHYPLKISKWGSGSPSVLQVQLTTANRSCRNTSEAQSQPHSWQDQFALSSMTLSSDAYYASYYQGKPWSISKSEVWSLYFSSWDLWYIPTAAPGMFLSFHDQECPHLPHCLLGWGVAMHQCSPLWALHGLEGALVYTGQLPEPPFEGHSYGTHSYGIYGYRIILPHIRVIILGSLRKSWCRKINNVSVSYIWL